MTRHRPVDPVYIGLGSNLGDREAHLAAAAEALGRIDAVSVRRWSRLYDTEAVGPPQPRYLNAVVELECELSPRRLLSILQRIEQELGRTAKGLMRPRTIDLDVLLWGERILVEPDFQIPHAELHARRFVLEPLAELAPTARHPVLGLTIRQLLESLPPADVAPVRGSSVWRSPPERKHP
ncbi:MAG TPA: 2-amino-4-hydroxy-6-hydroxymethyldihydropteridine diphosphokinase [Myxococcaceae bacterium]|nr:2-amino-4-hydroxy-6-hydroxymethyldihydropteridine diphosphokinase [Myxococcaceae bacterium]